MKVSVIGAGTMGQGIAQIAATQGCMVELIDRSEEALLASEKKLAKILARLIEKERITPEKAESIKNNIHRGTSLDSVEGSNLVIEAIIENLEIKKSLFQELESRLSPEAILATNTSSLSVTSIASALEHPERCIGIHFFNPAPVMKLVEVIPAIQTREEITTQVLNLITSWNKTVVQAKDTPGFIVNRIARPFYSEAIRIYEEGIADIASIDLAMTEIGGFRMGPFSLMDFIGHDVNYAVTESVWKAFYYDPRYKPAFSQLRLVEAGFLGRKSGRGFLDYREGSPLIKSSIITEKSKEIVDRIVAMLINEAADALHLGIATAADIEKAMTKGVNYPQGLLSWADMWGIKKCVLKMDELYDHYHEDRYRCSPLLRSMLRREEKFLS